VFHRETRRDPPTIEDTRVVTPPRICPFCCSADLSSNGRVTIATYYRCNKCGQAWNPQLLQTIGARGR